MFALTTAQVALGFVSVLFVQPDTRNVPTLLLLAVAITFLGAAFGLARTAPTDDHARFLSLLFVTIASPASMLLQPSHGQPLGSLGAVLTVVLPETLLPYFLWSFVECFPRTSPYGPFGPLLQRVRTACLFGGVFLLVINALHRSGATGAELLASGAMAPLFRKPVSVYWLALLGAALPAPFVALRRARETAPEEQRRALLFVQGLCFGFLPLFVAVLAELIVPGMHEHMSQPELRRLGSVIVYGSLLTVPFTTSLAVGAHFFKIRPMLQKAARQALARHTLMVLSYGFCLALVVFLWLHRHRSLAALATSRSVWVLVTCALLGQLLLWWRPKILVWLAGFGHEVNSSQALSEFARDIQTVRDLRELEELISQHSYRLLEVPRTRLLLLSETEEAFLSVSGSCRPLDNSSLIGSLARGGEGSLSFDVLDPSSLARWLPENEQRWLADHDVGLVVPLTDPGGKDVGLLLFERKIDLEPLEAEDRQVVQILASTTLLGIARLQLVLHGAWDSIATGSDDAAGECQLCGSVMDLEDGRCRCGGDLKPSVVPGLVRGKFRVERLLGAGGMGRVYLAFDRDLHREVALKTLPRLQTKSLARLHREAQSMATFVHPNLATIFGVETWRSVPILVVEYLAGGTLSDAWAGRLSPIAVAELGAKLAGALHAMHTEGLLHRDVKPSNIGFDSAGEPKLLDFGLAGLIEHPGVVPTGVGGSTAVAPAPSLLTPTNHIVGTPLYLSPEALQGKCFSVAEDLWSLHLVLWEALAGHHPMARMSPEAAIAELRQGRVPKITSARPDCPDDLARFLDEGLGAQEKRPRTADAMRQRLLPFLR